jgi:hypothetical protein
VLGHKMCLATMSHTWDCYITKLGVRNMRLFHYLKIGEWFGVIGEGSARCRAGCRAGCRLGEMVQLH